MRCLESGLVSPENARYVLQFPAEESIRRFGFSCLVCSRRSQSPLTSQLELILLSWLIFLNSESESRRIGWEERKPDLKFQFVHETRIKLRLQHRDLSRNPFSTFLFVDRGLSVLLSLSLSLRCCSVGVAVDVHKIQCLSLLRNHRDWLYMSELLEDLATGEFRMCSIPCRGSRRFVADAGGVSVAYRNR